MEKKVVHIDIDKFYKIQSTYQTIILDNKIFSILASSIIQTFLDTNLSQVNSETNLHEFTLYPQFSDIPPPFLINNIDFISLSSLNQ